MQDTAAVTVTITDSSISCLYVCMQVKAVSRYCQIMMKSHWFCQRIKVCCFLTVSEIMLILDRLTYECAMLESWKNTLYYLYYTYYL